MQDKIYTKIFNDKLTYLRSINFTMLPIDNHESVFLCGAVLRIPLDPAKWVMIPCADQIPSNYFLCEMKQPQENLPEQYINKRATYSCIKKSTYISGSCFNIRYSSVIAKHSPLTSDALLNYLTAWSLGNYFRSTILVAFNNGSKEYLVSHDFPAQRLKMWHLVRSSTSLRVAQILVKRKPLKYKRACNFHQHLACPTSACILTSYICNGINDCGNGHDETDCKHVCVNGTDCQNNLTDVSNSCSKMHYKCLSGECVPLSDLCDWKSHCLDNSDERNCNVLSDLYGDVSVMQAISANVHQVRSQTLHTFYNDNLGNKNVQVLTFVTCCTTFSLYL